MAMLEFIPLQYIFGKHQVPRDNCGAAEPYQMDIALLGPLSGRTAVPLVVPGGKCIEFWGRAIHF